MQPWSAEHAAGRITRPLRANGVAYQGINVLVLWGEAMHKGYSAPIWMTFRQALELNAHVRKGERGSTVVYASTITRNGRDENRRGIRSDDPVPQILHRVQCRADRRFAAAIPRRCGAETRSGAAHRTGRGVLCHDPRRHQATAAIRAYYNIGSDFVQMPAFEAFRDAESYYATLAHECTHWTRHDSRLAREFGRKRWGDAGYAMEELVAELGSAFLCADLDLTPETREDHAAYIASWLEVLKNDKRAIFSAAAHAQRAADFLAGLQAKAEEQVAA